MFSLEVLKKMLILSPQTNEIMKKKGVWIYIIFFPFFFQLFTYYGFQSSYYPYRIQENPTEWYYKGIYGYRLISREGVDFLTSFIRTLMQNDFPLKDWVVEKGTSYYHSLFIFNTFFAVLTSLMLAKLLDLKVFFGDLSEKIKLVIIFFAAAISGFSQYVIVHYDNSAIFLMLAGFYFTFKFLEKKENKYMALLCLVIFVSTLNRETSCLNISFLVALFVDKFPSSLDEYKKVFTLVILPVAAFLLPYFLLRGFIDQKDGQEYYFYESITLKHNLIGLNQIAGWVYAILVIKFLYFFAVSNRNKRMMTNFLLFSLPYLVMIFLVGILWETRLFVPVFYGLLLLAFANNNLGKLKPSTTDGFVMS